MIHDDKLLNHHPYHSTVLGRNFSNQNLVILITYQLITRYITEYLGLLIKSTYLCKDSSGQLQAWFQGLRHNLYKFLSTSVNALFIIYPTIKCATISSFMHDMLQLQNFTTAQHNTPAINKISRLRIQMLSRDIQNAK